MPELAEDRELITGDSSLMNPLQSILGALQDETFRADILGDPEQLQKQDFVPVLSTVREGIVAKNRFEEAQKARNTISSILRNAEGTGHALLAAMDFATPGIPLAGFAGTFGSMGFKSFDKLAPQLDEAVGRLLKGENPEQVRKDTGFFIAGDGFPRYEFSDATARVDMSKLPKNSAANVKIRDLIDHDILYNEYPDMEKIQVRMETNPKNAGSFQGRFDYQGNLIGGTIWIDPKAPKEQVTATLLHEMQHWIQAKEMIAEGSDPALFKAFREHLPEAERERESFAATVDFAKWLKQNPKRAKDNIEKLVSNFEQVNGVSLKRELAEHYYNGDVSVADLKGMLYQYDNELDFMRNLTDSGDGFNYFRTMGEVEARDVANRWLDLQKGVYTAQEAKDIPPVLNAKEVAVVSKDNPNHLAKKGDLRLLGPEEQIVIRRSAKSRANEETTLSDLQFGMKRK